MFSRGFRESPQSIVIDCLMLICPGIGVARDSLSAADIAKIKRVHRKYEEAWLKGDADGVRALCSPCSSPWCRGAPTRKTW